jgi:hypothetical protein
MALMTHRPVRHRALKCRLGVGDASKCGGDVGIANDDCPKSEVPAIADQKLPENNAARYRICLECALPLNISEHRENLECCCVQDEVIDEWLDIGGWEIAFILGLALACMAVSYWFCF